jgi:RNA ligase (TIGR02306 family)
MSSTFKVPLTKITEILPHANAHSLEFARVYGFDVIVKKDSYKVGDEVVFIPVDSVLPTELEYHLFPANSKIKLSKSRVKQIRIRKLASQGMLISPEDVQKVYNFTPKKVEEDLAKKLKIVKYQPPAPKYQQNNGTNQHRKKKPLENSNFQKYNGLNNIKWHPHFFEEGEIVVYQEKIHGSNARASRMPYEAHGIIDKIKGWLGLNPESEFCYGSNNVQLQRKVGYVGFYGEDVYGKVFKKLEAEKKLKVGETIFGELYGAGIQKNYQYGLKDSQGFVLFDVKILQSDGSQKWLSPDEVVAFGIERGFKVVPELYRGPYGGLDHAKGFTLGSSVMSPSQKVREGIVVKSLGKYSDERSSKRALKVISEKYLDKDQSDFH